MLAILIGSSLYSWHAFAKVYAIDPPVLTLGEQSVTSVDFVWPEKGRAAVGITGADGAPNCRLSDDNSQHPTASIAKVITALVVLEKYPLEGELDGPIITMTAADVAELAETRAVGGSFVPIELGEQLSEQQMLQGMLIRSGNNIANSLARWAFGSLEQYTEAANLWLKQHGLTDTIVGSDASGLDPSTMSTADDLCKLILVASKNPVLIDIMGTQTLENFPVAGTLTNTNELLGVSDVFAGKTGFTGDAGYGMVSLAHLTIDGQQQTVALVILGQGSYEEVFNTTRDVLAGLTSNLTLRNITTKGQVVGHLTSEWGAQTELVADDDLAILTWADQTTSVPLLSRVSIVDSSRQQSYSQGEIIGTLEVNQRSISVIAKNTLAPPVWWWRLLHGI